MSFHRFVEIECRERWHIKSREPHGAYEDERQRVVGVFEAVFDVCPFRGNLVHLLAMRNDIESFLCKEFGFLGFLADDDCHLHTLHIFDYLGQAFTLRSIGALVALFDEEFEFLIPILLHFVVHGDRRIFIHGYDHTLATESASWEVLGNILCYFLQSVVALDDL